MKTATEKYNAVLEGKLPKSEFVRQMRLQFPNYVSQFDDFKSASTILKNRGLVFEVEEPKSKKYLDDIRRTVNPDALRTGRDYELAKMGVNEENPIPFDIQQKAEEKALENLKKNPSYYVNLQVKEEDKVESSYPRETPKRGAKGAHKYKDKENAMQVVKEGLQFEKYKEGEEVMFYMPGRDTPVPGIVYVDGSNENPPFYDIQYKGGRGIYKNISPKKVTKQKKEVSFKERFMNETKCSESEFTEYLKILQKGKTLTENKGKKVYFKDLTEGFEKHRKEKMEPMLNEILEKSIVGMIEEVLSEGELNEAAAHNLEKYINYENEHNEDLASRVRKAAKGLSDIISQVEKDYLDIREKVEDLYASVGSFMAPALADAFKKDVNPVLKKYHSIQLPKAKMLSDKEKEELGLSGNVASFSTK